MQPSDCAVNRAKQFQFHAYVVFRLLRQRRGTNLPLFLSENTVTGRQRLREDCWQAAGGQEARVGRSRALGKQDAGWGGNWYYVVVAR